MGSQLEKILSIQAVIISVLLHIAFVLGMALVPKYVPPPRPTEIEVIYNPASAERTIVTDTKLGELTKKLEEQSRRLSEYTRRVEKEMIARHTGQSVNRSRNPIIGKTNKVEDNEDSDQPLTRNPRQARTTRSDSGEPVPFNEASRSRPLARMQPGLEVSLDPSTISEYIPFVEEGGFTSLNTDQFSFYSFYARNNPQIRNRWVFQVRDYTNQLGPAQFNKLAQRTRITEVEVALNRRGEHVATSILRSSGVRELDQAATFAMERAAPYLNPPVDMVESDGLIHLTYRFYITFRPVSLVRTQD